MVAYLPSRHPVQLGLRMTSQCDLPISPRSGPVLSPQALLAPFEFITKEQRVRCERVELVHFLTHAGDDALCRALDSGAYPWADVTSADVRINRKW